MAVHTPKSAADVSKIPFTAEHQRAEGVRAIVGALSGMPHAQHMAAASQAATSGDHKSDDRGRFA